MNKKRIYTFRNDLKRRLKNPKFKEEWEQSEVEYQLARELIKKRLEKGLSQRELARLTKTSQAKISQIESMKANPSIAFLKRLAAALDVRIRISFN